MRTGFFIDDIIHIRLNMKTMLAHGFQEYLKHLTICRAIGFLVMFCYLMLYTIISQTILLSKIDSPIITGQM